MKAVKKDFEKFRRNLRNRYKKAGHPMKYIYTIEIGKRGGIHIHYLVNRIRGEPNTYDMICECWKHGHPNFKPIYEDGGYNALAEYMAKVPEEGDEWFVDTDKDRYDFGTSRNLIRPTYERKEYKRRTVEKLIKEGPEASRGFEIIKESIRMGENRYTGYSYLYYTERRIKSWIHKEE
jgi:hypothetical protein